MHMSLTSLFFIFVLKVHNEEDKTQIDMIHRTQSIIIKGENNCKKYLLKKKYVRTCFKYIIRYIYIYPKNK